MNLVRLLITGLLMCCVCSNALGLEHRQEWDDFASADGYGKKMTGLWSFNTAETENLPQGWRSDGANHEGVIGTWIVKSDSSKPEPTGILALTTTPEGMGNIFNLCWTDDVTFNNGSIEVLIKRTAGVIDQGGGIIWRVQDRDNYYLTRWNPLEDNMRLYHVINGRRQELASAHVEADPNAWHTLRIEQTGAEIHCFFDGEKVLETVDTSFTAAGGVGLWTKADATTTFDDFEVKRWATSGAHSHEAP